MKYVLCMKQFSRTFTVPTEEIMLHYENKPIQIYWKFYRKKKKKKKSDKNSYIFHKTAQNIHCGYSLEPPRRGGLQVPTIYVFEQK